MEEIVVGVDGSEPSKRALAWALQQAQGRGDTTVVVVHAYSPPDVRSAGGVPRGAYQGYLSASGVTGMVEQERRWREEHDEAAQTYAEAVVERALDEVEGGIDGVEVKIVTLARDATKALLEMARGADLLVVGSRGLGGFKGLLMGSVSQQLTHHAPCPVVVVR